MRIENGTISKRCATVMQSTRYMRKSERTYDVIDRRKLRLRKLRRMWRHPQNDVTSIKSY